MPIVVTADDITSALTHTDAAADAIDVAVDACPSLPLDTRAQWKAFLLGYRAFSAANKDHSFFALGLPAIGDQTLAYEHELAGWSAAIKTACPNLVAPAIVPQDTPRDDVANLKPLLIGAGAIAALAILLSLRR